MISSFVESVTRNAGKRFLKLNEDVDGLTVNSSDTAQDKQASLYIHIPFCRTLCPFCCFNRYLFKGKEARSYFKSLRRELDLYIQRGFNFSNFYFGGGTPTILMDELISFINYLRENFGVKQVSVETMPRETNRENIELLKAAGVNRLSIGVQSFDNDILKAMGRSSCSGEELKEKLLMAQGEFDTLNVDLIFNFPSQTIEKFEADVNTFKDLGIDQATFYPLMPSPHKKNALEQRFSQVDISREREFYEVILRNVYDYGYKASTAWCFSRGDRMIDEYIVDFDDYIGIGAGSVSFLAGNIYVNSFPLDRYREFLAGDRLPIVRWGRLSRSEYSRYYLLTKLFGMQLSTGEFRRKFGTNIYKRLGAELLFFRLFGLIREENGEITVTRKGMYQINVMMREFFASLNSLREYCIENRI